MKTKTIKSLLFAMLFLQGLFVNSQTFYETKFKDLSGNTYLGLMVYYSDSNCYMRIPFTQSNVYSVVNVEYESITGNSDGVNYMYLIGKNPTFITGNLYEGYNPEHFIWIWNENETTEKPFYTTDPEFNLENIYLVEYFNTLDISQISDAYLKQFYASNDPDYLSFLGAINNVNVFDTYDFQSSGEVTLHLFVVANTLIGDIGQSCSVDKRNIVSEFDGIAEALSIPIRKYIVDENKFTRSELINKMNEITTGSNDVIVFLYTGHGFRWNDQEDYYPQLDLRAINYQNYLLKLL
ncbi:MAG: hypothetical protein IPH20_08845 [Bacteroidales bacterium]|nr:hypothetical protein [Bacteroidales bacterium]